MKLNNETLKNRAEWEAKGYRLPEYDRAAMIARTKANPTWLHFGAGNIFKALHGMAAQRLLNEGVLDKGIIAVERMDRGGEKFDDLAVVVTLKADLANVAGEEGPWRCVMVDDTLTAGSVTEAVTVKFRALVVRLTGRVAVMVCVPVPDVADSE